MADSYDGSKVMADTFESQKKRNNLRYFNKAEIYIYC